MSVLIICSYRSLLEQFSWVSLLFAANPVYSPSGKAMILVRAMERARRKGIFSQEFNVKLWEISQSIQRYYKTYLSQIVFSFMKVVISIFVTMAFIFVNEEMRSIWIVTYFQGSLWVVMVCVIYTRRFVKIFERGREEVFSIEMPLRIVCAAIADGECWGSDARLKNFEHLKLREKDHGFALRGARQEHCLRLLQEIRRNLLQNLEDLKAKNFIYEILLSLPCLLTSMLWGFKVLYVN